MSEIESYEGLEVYKVAHELVVEIYRITATFPAYERYRLTDQLCRSAASVPANIAEGYGRHHRREIIRFLYIARGSGEETRYHLLLARDLGYIDGDTCQRLRDRYVEVSKMLNGLIAYHKRKLEEETRA
jgi:four helix bundle protein